MIANNKKLLAPRGRRHQCHGKTALSGRSSPLNRIDTIIINV
jgi:hypothetical protein